MSALLVAEPRLGTGGDVRLAREDIVFYNVAPGRVRLEVTVCNQGDRRSAPTPAHIQAAPLGAFVPWRPVTTLLVPSLEPGGSFRLEAEAVPAKATPLGAPDRVPPQRLLTALGLGDNDRRPSARHRPRDAGVAAGQVGSLAADLMQLLRQGGAHWAGNLNVFVGGRDVERHLAQALRIYPGKVNMAMFVVGEGRDAYAFELAGDGAAWDATLHDVTGRESFALARREKPLPERKWIDVPSLRMLMLELRPPADCGRGTVEVHVEQRSSGKTAVVEFSLDPAAAGPGCYVV